MNRATLDALRAARRERRAVTLVTELASGRQEITSPLEGEVGPEGRVRGRSRLLADTEKAGPPPHPSTLRVSDLSPGGIGKTGVIAAESGEMFVHVFEPTPRLIVVGAVHTAQRLVPLARLADFAVTVIDPREGFASVERFPDVALVQRWPDRAMEELAPDSATAVVTLTHDPKLDDPALAVALRSPAFYVGALGSRKTHARRLERLAAEGLDEAALARIHAPVGLPIGALSPGEIAVSIMAEIVAARHGRRLASVG